MAVSAASREVRVIGLVGTAHSFSHFYQLVLPPLFLTLNRELGYSFTELGLLMSIFYAVSGICQTPLGFLVDRVGARPVLFVGLGLLAGATTLYGVRTDYPSLVVLVMLAGLGNSVFHPADFSILSATVSEQRMGRAFSIHAFGGLIGYGLAPMIVIFLAGAWGWRTATVVVGVAGLVYLAALMALSGDFRDSAQATPRADAPQSAPGSAALLLRLPIVMFLLFFVVVAMAHIGVQNFTPVALNDLYAIPELVAGKVLTAFLIGMPVGVLIGGVLADRTSRHNLLTIVCMAVPALLLLVGCLGQLGETARMVLFAV